MILYKNDEEVELIRQSCKLVNDAIAEVALLIKPGISTMELNDRADEYIRDHGAIPSFKNYQGFPFACCMSVNDAVVHGFPTNVELKEGDVVSVDVGAYKNKFHGDSAYTFALGTVSDEVKHLMKVTKESLYKGIEK
ncbi:MAG: M24 family metallopeptidase, partial [Ginsengibacter sp.]